MLAHHKSNFIRRLTVFNLFSWRVATSLSTEGSGPAEGAKWSLRNGVFGTKFECPLGRSNLCALTLAKVQL